MTGKQINVQMAEYNFRLRIVIFLQRKATTVDNLLFHKSMSQLFRLSLKFYRSNLIKIAALSVDYLSYIPEGIRHRLQPDSRILLRLLVARSKNISRERWLEINARIWICLNAMQCHDQSFSICQEKLTVKMSLNHSIFPIAFVFVLNLP